MRHILKQGCNKLREIRKTNKNAAGLVVASSVQHAKTLLNLLQVHFNQTAVLVTYKQAQASNIINEFKDSQIQWVVSVGMVSEGTDIPRLQVCCHLSRIKTELYFRQVLGRILRVTQERNQEAWLFTFAEPTLIEFAHRIALDLPNHDVVINDELTTEHNSIEDLLYESSDGTDELIETNSKNNEIPKPNSNVAIDLMDEQTQQANTLEVLGMFRQQVIATFNSPFGC